MIIYTNPPTDDTQGNKLLNEIAYFLGWMVNVLVFKTPGIAFIMYYLGWC